MDHLNQSWDNYINTVNSETAVKVPWAKCFPTESMLKLPEVSFNNYSATQPGTFSQQIHLLGTITMQYLAGLVANKVSFYPENEDFAQIENKHKNA